MGTTEIIVTIVVGILAVFAGIFMGAMPMKRDQITEAQNKYQQLGGVLACGVLVILILLDMNVASWVEIGALALGIVISRIPPLHKALLKQFPILQPAEPGSPLKRANPKSRK